MELRQLRRWGRVALFLLALVLLVWMLDRIGWTEIADAFARVGWGGAALLMFLGFLETYFDSSSFCACLSGKLGVWRSMSYSGAGALVNTLIPWEAGEALKGTLLTRHVSTSEAIQATVVWNYLFKLSRPIVALLAALVGVFCVEPIDPALIWLVVGASVLALAPYFLLKLLLRFGMLETGVRILKRLRVIRKDAEGITRAAHDVDQGIRDFKREFPTDYWKVLIHQMLARFTAWVAWGVSMWLVGLDYSLGLISLIYAALSVSGYVVMLFPVRIGVAEGTGYLVFAMLGLDGGAGLIQAVIMRIKALLSNGIPGIFAAFRGRRPQS